MKIKSIKTSSILESVPLSITKINIPRLWSKQQLSLQEYINSIPGIVSFNANNFAQDLRISVRGFGARSAFGIRGIKIIVEKQTILKISGADKQLVGMITSKIKSIRPPEPYKGKGIKEQGQYILRKEGKKK